MSPAAVDPQAADDPGIVRAIGRWALVALTVNSIIGSGIFGLPSRVHAMIGPHALLAYGACAGIVILIALCFAEVSSRFSRTGGPYLYAKEAFGPIPGFAIGWLMWLTRVAAIAAICHIMADYLAYFWAPAAAGPARALAMGGVMAVLTGINLIGVRQAAGAASLFAIAKLVPLLLFVAVGPFALNPDAFVPAEAPAVGSFSRAVLVLIFAFVGFETTTVAAGEARDPRRDIPFALFVGIGVSTAVYVLVQIVCIGTVPALGESARPLADASMRLAGPAGAAFISIGALVSTTGTLLAAVITGPRVIYAIGVQGQLPEWFSRTHARWHTPHTAILVTSAAGFALAITGTFAYLATLSVIARLGAYVASALALIVLRRRKDAPPAAFRLPAGGFVVTLAVAACVWLVTTSAMREVRDVGIATAVGFALYAAHAALHKQRASHASR